MRCTVTIIVACLVCFGGSVSAQEVVITGFPVGVGSSIDDSFLEPYYPSLQAAADTLNVYPLARAIVTGGADGERYRRANDAMNPALALGRAHVLRGVLIDKFGVDSTQIVIKTEEVDIKGERYRFASLRVEREIARIESRLQAVEARPPVEREIVRVEPAPPLPPIEENLGLRLGAGVSTSPYGGLPIVTAAVSWRKKALIEGVLGHSFWTSSYRFDDVDLDTKRRMIGLHGVYYPDPDIPVGVLGGWVRVEEMSDRFYEYVQLSEGPLLGVRARPLQFIAVTAAWNPSKQREAERVTSRWDSDQFLIWLTANLSLGGAR